MATQVLMPKLGLTMTEGSVVSWLKEEGDAVEKGEELVEVLTEKINNVVEAPSSGVLRKILVGPGETVKVSEPIGIIADPEEEIEVLAAPKEGEMQVVEKKPKETKPAKRPKASPVARKLAQEHSIDLMNVEGTGPGGRIIKEDVLQAAKDKEAKLEIVPSPVRGPAVEAKRVPLAGMRKTIAEQMSESARVAPHVTLNIEVDMERAVAIRQLFNTGELDYFKSRISFTDILVKVVARALEDFAVINSSLQAEEIVYNPQINIGVAVALEDGLIVPVIKNANEQRLSVISEQVRELAKKARRGELNPDECEGGTFTITNLGMFGIDSFTPIINPPEGAILGVNRIQKKPVVVGDEITIKPMMNLSLSFDHRIIDGSVAAQFLCRVKDLLENPSLILL